MRPIVTLIVLGVLGCGPALEEDEEEPVIVIEETCESKPDYPMQWLDASHGRDILDDVEITLSLENTSDKGVDAFKFDVESYDDFGDEVDGLYGGVNVTSDWYAGLRSSVTWSGTWREAATEFHFVLGEAVYLDGESVVCDPECQDCTLEYDIE